VEAGGRTDSDEERASEHRAGRGANNRAREGERQGAEEAPSRALNAHPTPTGHERGGSQRATVICFVVERTWKKERKYAWPKETRPATEANVMTTDAAV